MSHPEVLLCSRPGCGHYFRKPLTDYERKNRPHGYCSPSCETAHAVTGAPESMDAKAERFMSAMHTKFDEIFRNK